MIEPVYEPSLRWGEELIEARLFAEVLDFGEYSIVLKEDLSFVYSYCIEGWEKALKVESTPNASIIFFDTKEYKKYFTIYTFDNSSTIYAEMYVKVWIEKFNDYINNF